MSNERTKIRIAPIERGPCGKNESEFSEDSDRNDFNQFDFGRMRTSKFRTISFGIFSISESCTGNAIFVQSVSGVYQFMDHEVLPDISQFFREILGLICFAMNFSSPNLEHPQNLWSCFVSEVTNRSTI